MATIEDTMKAAILEKIPDAAVQVAPGSGGGHFTVQVVSPVFEGKSMLDGAPVHAIDSLKTRTS